MGDACAAVGLALVRFNKDVFVGPVLMGPAVGVSGIRVLIELWRRHCARSTA